MSLVRSMTGPRASLGMVAGIGGRRFGLGASYQSWHDTGGGINPDTFQSRCCSGMLAKVGYLDAGECYDFVRANSALFGSEYPCSAAGIQNLKMELPVSSVGPIPAPAVDTDPESSTYGQAIDPCTGRPAVTADEIQAMVTCLAKRQAAAQAAEVTRSMTEAAAGQCVAIKADCINRTFAPFLSPSSDCTDCVFDWTKPGSLFLIGGGLLLGGLLLAKLIR